MTCFRKPFAPLAATALILAMTASVSRAGPGTDADLVRATLVADVAAVAPGGTFTVGVRLKVKPHWHVYWVNPGESGEATRVALSGPAGFAFGPTQFPLPKKFDAFGGISYGYENEVLLLVPVTVSKDVPAGTDVTLRADVNWLSCADTCIPGSAKPTITLPVRAGAAPANSELFDTWRQRLPVAKERAAAEALSGVEQPAGGDGVPQPTLTVRWKAAPTKVEWFPVSTRAVAIENVVVEHDGRQTRIQFKPTIYQAGQVPDGRVESVLVYDDAAGRRHGVTVPFGVAKPR